MTIKNHIKKIISKNEDNVHVNNVHVNNPLLTSINLGNNAYRNNEGNILLPLKVAQNRLRRGTLQQVQSNAHYRSMLSNRSTLSNNKNNSNGGGKKKTKSKRKIYIGPRGGKYYKSKGRKVYI